MSDVGASPAGDTSGERVKESGTEASEAVQRAASVFEEELAAGLAGVEKLEERFRAERRIDPGELNTVVQRFRDDGHNVIDVLAERLGDFQSEDLRSLAQRFIKDAHGLLDTVANLVNLAPDLVNQRTDHPGPASGEKSGDGDQ
jgi:hypothetical protein